MSFEAFQITFECNVAANYPYFDELSLHQAALSVRDSWAGLQFDDKEERATPILVSETAQGLFQIVFDFDESGDDMFIRMQFAYS